MRTWFIDFNLYSVRTEVDYPLQHFAKKPNELNLEGECIPPLVPMMTTN